MVGQLFSRAPRCLGFGRHRQGGLMHPGSTERRPGRRATGNMTLQQWLSSGYVSVRSMGRPRRKGGVAQRRGLRPPRPSLKGWFRARSSFTLCVACQEPTKTRGLRLRRAHAVCQPGVVEEPGTATPDAAHAGRVRGTRLPPGCGAPARALHLDTRGGSQAPQTRTGDADRCATRVLVTRWGFAEHPLSRRTSPDGPA